MIAAGVLVAEGGDVLVLAKLPSSEFDEVGVVGVGRTIVELEVDEAGDK